MEAAFEDPITYETMVDAVISPCGHTFSKESIISCLSQRSSCPLCNTKITKTQLQPNYAIRNAIQQWQQSKKSGNQKAQLDDEVAQPPQQKEAGPNEEALNNIPMEKKMAWTLLTAQMKLFNTGLIVVALLVSILFVPSLVISIPFFFLVVFFGHHLVQVVMVQNMLQAIQKEDFSKLEKEVQRREASLNLGAWKYLPFSKSFMTSSMLDLHKNNSIKKMEQLCATLKADVDLAQSMKGEQKCTHLDKLLAQHYINVEAEITAFSNKPLE